MNVKRLAVLVVFFVMTGCFTGEVPTSPDTISETITKSGGSIQLSDVAKADFLPGSLDNNEVTLSKVESADLIKDFSDTASPLFGSTVQNGYQVTIAIKGNQPATSTNVTLTIPIALVASAPSGSELRAFYTLYQISDDEREKTVEPLPDRFAVDAKTIIISLPPEAFSGDASENFSVYEATIYLAFTPTASASDPATKGPFSKAQTAKADDNDSGQCTGASLVSPVDPSTPISSPFGKRIHPITGKSSFHTGVDFKVASATPVKAMSDGTIKKTAYQFNPKDKTGWGQYVVLLHPDGSTSLYAHLTEGSALPEGTSVKAGDQIALSGASGGVTGAHLHVEYAPNGKTYDKASKADPVPCLGSQTVGSITVGDNGPAADDAFLVSLNSAKICETQIGATNNCSLGKLRTGHYILTLLCTVAEDDYGTYGISLSNGLTFVNGSTSSSGVLTQGGSINFTIVAP